MVGVKGGCFQLELRGGCINGVARLRSGRQSQRELDQIIRASAVDSETRAIRTPIRQHREHPAEHRTQLGLERRSLEKEPGNSAHRFSSKETLYPQKYLYVLSLSIGSDDRCSCRGCVPPRHSSACVA